MKRYYIKLIVLCIIVMHHTSKAQVNLVPNNSFETFCGTYDLTCFVISPTCTPGWFASHGSPNMELYSGLTGFNGTEEVIMTCHQNNLSDGLGSNLTSTVEKDKQYALCFAYCSTDPHTATNYTVNLAVKLTNGLPHNPGCSAVGSAPVTSPMQQVLNMTFTITPGVNWSTWQTVSVNFTADADYTQFIIYPSSTVPYVGYVAVDAFSLIENTTPCQTPMDYDNTSSPVPAGIYDQKSVIRAGSHITNPSNPGIVTVNQPVQTKFAASNYIELSENFIAYPQRSYFLATIEYCDAVCQFTTDGSQNSRKSMEGERDEEMNELPNDITLFPNPASDQLTVQSSKGLRSVVLKDISGRLVMTFQPEAGKKEQIFRIPDIKTGIYFLTLTDESGKTEIKKIAIEK